MGIYVIAFSIDLSLTQYLSCLCYVAMRMNLSFPLHVLNTNILLFHLISASDGCLLLSPVKKSRPWLSEARCCILLLLERHSMAQQFSGLPRSPRVNFKLSFPGKRVLLSIMFEASTVLKTAGRPRRV